MQKYLNIAGLFLSVAVMLSGILIACSGHNISNLISIMCMATCVIHSIIDIIPYFTKEKAHNED